MSTCDKNKEMNNPIKSNGIVDDVRPCCSTSSNIENNKINNADQKLKGTSIPIRDCNTHQIINGAYPKAIPASNSNHESSGVKKCSTLHSSEKADEAKNGISHDKNNKELLLKNNGKCQQENASCSDTIQKTPNDTKKVVAFDYDKNSSSEDEECCIYTYKGDSNQMADLPSSFFRLDFKSSKVNGNSRNSSPDMDYLEMDFDPGPSNDRYSSSSSESEHEEQYVSNGPFSLPVPCEFGLLESNTTPPSSLSTPSPVRFEQPCSSVASNVMSPPSSPLRQTSVSDIDSSILQPSFCYCVANKLSPTSIDENFNDGEAGTMVWKEQEAKEKQVTQIATSACGATAVINVLLGLNVPFSVSSVRQHVATRLRRDTALIPDYLQSRCHAGATHVDMIRGLHNASNELVYARFFHMYPQRSISLTSWLSHWIRKGAVPIVTRNLQRGVRPGTEVPDMWHHQMVYGVSSHGIHLTNPLEVQTEPLLWPQLASPSVLKVRRYDILSRWTPDTALHHLAHPSLPLWRKLNVLGQVVTVIRESSQANEHITIPASYCSGITLAVLRNSPVYDELRFTPELPIDPFASS